MVYACFMSRERKSTPLIKTAELATRAQTTNWTNIAADLKIRECQVDLEFGDGRSVTWVKGAKKNQKPYLEQMTAKLNQ